MGKFISLMILSSSLFLNAGVLQTGQTKSYDQNGNVVESGIVHDDGSYRAGYKRSYSRSNGIVTDNVTYLLWQDDYSDNGADVKHTDWKDAQTYCKNLHLGYGEWRLPTIEELETLIDSGHYDPSLTPNIFKAVAPGDFGYGPYWTSSIDSNNKVQTVWFNRGLVRVEDKGNYSFVRCVQGEHFKKHSFTRNNSKQIVTDNTTKLQWQDSDTSSHSIRRWIDAINYCEKLSLGGYSDWRLPNFNELLSIVDYSRTLPAIDPVFNHKSSDQYITSTTDATLRDNGVWYVNFHNGGTNPSGKTQSSQDFNIRCVRGELHPKSPPLPPKKDNIASFLVPILYNILF